MCDRDPEQWWFWTPEWQVKEREADNDLANGDYVEYATMQDFIDDLPMTASDGGGEEE